MAVQALTPRRVGIGIALASCVVAAWMTGLIVFGGHIPATVTDSDTRTDAIVVLTGGSKRLDTGLQLLQRGMAKRVLVSGVHQDVDIDQLLRITPAAPTGLQCCIDAGHGALDTAGNAAETARWMRRHGFRSLRLVTGSYHMPRSLLEFGYAMPEARVIPHPVFPEEVKVERWWQWPGTAALVVSEYNKFLISWLHHALTPTAQEREVAP